MNSTPGHAATRVSFASRDGFPLVGDIFAPAAPTMVVVLVHGIMSERTEEGLYTKIAERLAARGIASIMVDYRAHGETGGAQRDLTLYGVLHDIEAAIQEGLRRTSCPKYSVVAASFGGGLAVDAALSHSAKLQTLVLLNPRLDYAHWLSNDRYWDGFALTDAAAQTLRTAGFLPHGDFQMGFGLVNELMSYSPASALPRLPVDILVIHGTRDSVTPFADSAASYNLNSRGTLLPIDGAEHGFVDPDTDDVTSPLSLNFRNQVIEAVTDWIVRHGTT